MSYRIRRLLPILLLCLLPLLPLWRAVVLGEAIGPFDQIRQMTPWNGPKPAQPWDVLQADGVLQFFPWRDMVFESWSKGQLPLWNPYELGGTPLLANSQSAGFYPPHILIGLLHLPTILGITLLAWFHLALAALGVFFLTRRLGANRLGSIVAAASFGLSPFMLGWTALASVISTVAWIPWMLGCLIQIFQASDSKSGKLLCFVGLAASTGMMLLAGHLQFAAYGLMAAAIVTTCLACFGSSLPDQEPAKNSKLRPLLSSVLLLALGACLSFPQLLPVLSYSKFSHRQNTPTSVGYNAYVKDAIQPFELANVSQANALGSPRAPFEIGDAKISEYWPGIAKQGANFTESACTIGPLILALLFVVPWRDRGTWPLAILGLFSLLLALGTPINMALYYFAPGWSASGSPGRVIVLFVLCACVLGGYAASHLEREAFKKQTAIQLLVGLLAGAAFAFGAPSLASIPAGPKQDLVSHLQGAALQSMLPTWILATVLTAIGLAVLITPGAKKYRLFAAIAPVLICWIVYGSNLIMTGKPLNKIEGVPSDKRVAMINSDWDLMVADKAVAPPNTASISRIHELGGYDSLIHRDSVALLQNIDGQGAAAFVNGNMMFVKPSANARLVADAGVTLAWYPGQPSPIVVPGPGRFSLVGGIVGVLDEGYDHLSLQTSGAAGPLTVRDRMMPGWSVSVDGAEQPIPDGLWRSAQIPSAGTHRVDFRYKAPGLTLGLALGAVAWLVLIGLLVGALANRKAQNRLKSTGVKNG